jgi:hypothetical protein
MITQAEIRKVLNNKNTRTLVEWLDNTIKLSNKYIMCPKFFHPTHSNRDRVVLVYLIKDFFDQIEKIDVDRNGSVLITLK